MAYTLLLDERRRQPEIMDQPGLDAAVHRHALVGLARLNWWSGSARILWPDIRSFAERTGRRRLRVLDLASGGGDVALGLWKRARRAGFTLDIHGVDLSPIAVDHARDMAHRHGAEMTFTVGDALADELPRPFDVVCSSLFLHHLAETQAALLLARMRDLARLVLINDLERSGPGLLLAHLATRGLTRSQVVRIDGPRSVESAYRLCEVAALATRAGLGGFELRRRWPYRYLLRWERPA